MVLWWYDDGDALLCFSAQRQPMKNKNKPRNKTTVKREREKEKRVNYILCMVLWNKRNEQAYTHKSIIIHWNSDSNCKPVNTRQKMPSLDNFSVLSLSSFHVFSIYFYFIFWTVYDSFFLIFCEHNSLFSQLSPSSLSLSFALCLRLFLILYLYVQSVSLRISFIFFVCVLSSKKMQSNWIKKKKQPKRQHTKTTPIEKDDEKERWQKSQ